MWYVEYLKNCCDAVDRTYYDAIMEEKVSDAAKGTKGRVEAHLKITGLVQGVFFRAHTREVAINHGVRGWVRNREDGSVEALLEGEDSAVMEVVKWCHKGPPSATVTDVTVSWHDATDRYNDFRVLS
jgi:acylphosphatase